MHYPTWLAATSFGFSLHQAEHKDIAKPKVTNLTINVFANIQLITASRGNERITTDECSVTSLNIR